MNKLDKLVEQAKYSIEDSCLIDIENWSYVCPSNANDVILFLGCHWYLHGLLNAGYSNTTINRKVRNMDIEDLANKLDDWYKQELYPKLIEKLKNEHPKLYKKALSNNSLNLNKDI